MKMAMYFKLLDARNGLSDTIGGSHGDSVRQPTYRSRRVLQDAPVCSGSVSSGPRGGLRGPAQGTRVDEESFDEPRRGGVCEASLDKFRRPSRNWVQGPGSPGWGDGSTQSIPVDDHRREERQCLPSGPHPREQRAGVVPTAGICGLGLLRTTADSL